MKRWLPLAVIVATLGVVLTLTWSHVFRPVAPDDGQSTIKQSLLKIPVPKTAEEKAVNELVAEFESRQKILPSPEALKKIQQLAAKGQPMAPLLEAWLLYIQVEGRADAAEFAALAQALLAVDGEAIGRAQKGYLASKTPGEKLFYANKLFAFGKAALLAVLDGLKTEVPAAGSFDKEATSLLPGVLALQAGDALPGLLAALKDPLLPVRRQAIRTFAVMGAAKAAPALPALEAALSDSEPSVRMFAALALGDLAPKDQAPSAALTAALNDGDPLVRLAAAHALSRHPAADVEPIVRVCLSLLKSKTALTQSWWDVGGGTTDITRTIRSSGQRYSQLYWEETAAHILVGLGPKVQLDPKEIVTMLRICQHDGQHLVHLLANTSDRGRNAVPDLLLMLGDEDGRQRRKALAALVRLGAVLGTDEAQAVRAALNHSDGKTRWQAFLTLAVLEPTAVKQQLPEAWQGAATIAAADPDRPYLAGVKQWSHCVWHHWPVVLRPADADAATAAAAAAAAETPFTLADAETFVERQRIEGVLNLLEKTGPQGQAGIPFLVALWQGSGRNEWSRPVYARRALKLLASEGPAAASAAPVLVRGLALFDQSDVEMALQAIGDPAVAALAAVLGEQDGKRVHSKALLALESFGSKAKAAAPAVLGALYSPDENVQAQAATTIVALGPAGVDALPELRKLLASDQAIVRRHTADALGRMGPQAAPALPDLIGLLKDDYQSVRVVVVRAIGKMGSVAVEPLSKALGSDHDKMRLSAIDALTLLGNDAMPAVPALRQLVVAEQDAVVLSAAKELLKALEKR